MREAGVVNKSLSGDPDTAATQISVARTQLGILKNQMRLGGLKIGSRSVRLADGTVIQVASLNGQDFINIQTTVPTSTSQADVLQDVTPPQVLLPIPTITDQPLAVFNALLVPDANNGTAFRPMYLDDVLLTAPDGKVRMLPATGTPTTRYRRSLKGGGDLFFARIDATTAQTLDVSQQPAKFKITSAAGVEIAPSYIATPQAVHAAGRRTTPPNLGYFQTPVDLLADTIFTIEGQSQSGANEVQGVLLIERTYQLGILPPTYESTDSTGRATYSTATLNGATVPPNTTQVYGCPNSVDYVCSFTPLYIPGTGAAPMGVSVVLYLMTADPAYASNLQETNANPQTLTTPDGYVGGRTTPAVWTQTGGNLAMQVDLTNNQLYRLDSTRNITAYGNYNATGTLLVTDSAGNTTTVPVSIMISYNAPSAS